MIRYDRLWKTMEDKELTQYRLIKQHGFSAGQIGRLKKNMHVSTHTIDTLCTILQCGIDDIMEFCPDETSGWTGPLPVETEEPAADKPKAKKASKGKTAGEKPEGRKKGRQARKGKARQGRRKAVKGGERKSPQGKEIRQGRQGQERKRRQEGKGRQEEIGRCPSPTALAAARAGSAGGCAPSIEMPEAV